MSTSFETVLEDFKKHALLTSKQTEDFKLDSLDDLRRTIKKIQQDQEAKRRTRYMKRLEPFLRTMDQFGKVVEVFANTSEVLAYVWGPMKWLLLVASNYAEALDSLLDAYQCIWEELPLLDSYQHLFEQRPYLQTVLSWIYQDIMDFHREAMSYFRQKAWKQVFQAVWRGFKLKIEWIKHRMQRHGALIKTEATLAEFEEIRHLDQTATIEFRRLRQAEIDRRRIFTIQWLSAPSSLDIQESHIDARSLCDNAGDWIVAETNFKDWSSPNLCVNPLLWITGKPGAGKSVLVSRIVTEVEKYCHKTSANAADGTLAYFYCKHLDHTRNTFLAVARGLLSQILAQQPSLLDFVYEQASLSGETTLGSKKMAQELLSVALRGSKTTYVIIDGFDECEKKSRKEVVSFFRAIVEGLPRLEMDSIRCLFVGQHDGVAERELSGIPKITIHPANNKCDIQRFSEHWSGQIHSKLGLNGLEGNLAKEVTARAQGMFLFAKLVMENLFEQTTRGKLMAEMERFPNGLDEAYARIVERIQDTRTESRRADALRLLEILVCAKRPMKWYEIQGALSVDLDTESDYDGTLESRRCQETPKDLCASLVEFRKDQTVEFVHPTAKEYLIRTTLENRLLLEYRISSLTIGYLGLPAVQCDIGDDVILEALKKGELAYLDYAATCWSLHLQDALGDQMTDESRSSLIEDVDVFIESHYRDGHAESRSSKAATDQLSPLRSSECFNKLLEAVIWAQRQLSINGKAPSHEDVLDLSEIILRVRTIMEALSTPGISEAGMSHLQSMYGTRWFKCPRMNCFYFHHGFKSATERDNHNKRHERPFMCIVPQCESSTFGFPTETLLKHHMEEVHGISAASELEFPDPKTPAFRPINASTRLVCDVCKKQFTRAYTLKVHTRSHTKEKPYACDQCEKRFPRTCDLLRHMNTHSKTTKYVCGGTLKCGEDWGCKKDFSRQDKLIEHFETKKGQQCIKPVLVEERGERQEGGLDEDAMKRVYDAIGVKSALLPPPLFLAHSSYEHTPALQYVESYVRTTSSLNQNSQGSL